jgi:hypothetical protein
LGLTALKRALAARAMNLFPGKGRQSKRDDNYILILRRAPVNTAGIASNSIRLPLMDGQACIYVCKRQDAKFFISFTV